MRLRRVEAVRFGRLESGSLGDLGDELTIVFGPNEAGKSTYTALVRHILYGFPTPGAKEPRFLSAAGKRHGRLVFEGAEGSWVVERTEGPHGGPVTIQTLKGPERPALVSDLTRGVSSEAYRVVLGFGLSDLAHIEELRGKDDDIVSRLYAAGAGLTISPQDVRASLEKAAEDLWAPRASTRTINQIRSRVLAVRQGLRELEDQAASFSSEREKLEALESELGELRERREQTAARWRSLEHDVGTLETLERDIDAMGVQLRDARKSVADVEHRLSSNAVDERVLAVAGDLDALMGELSAFRERLERIGKLEATRDDLTARIDAATGSLGRTRDTLPRVTRDTAASVDSWRDALSRADLTAEQSRRAATLAAAEAEAAEESASATRGAPGERARARVSLPALLLLAVGALAVAAGVATSQYVATAVGALLVIAGVVFAFARPAGPGAGTLSADAARLNDRAFDARERANAAAIVARSDEAALSRTRSEWSEWVAANALGDATADPAGVAAFIAALHEVQALETERDRREVEISREREAAERYAASLTAVVRSFMPEVEAADLGQVVPVATRARDALAQARTSADARERLTEDLGELRSRIGTLEADQATATAAAAAIIQAHTPEGGGLSDLRAFADVAQLDAEHSVAEFDELAREVTELKTRLGQEGRESRMGELRLELASLEERKQRVAAEYVTLALAAKLLASAQERYERDRQPQVVQTAEAVFERITDGRYTGLTIPLGGSDIRVFDRASSPHGSAELSRGTAEQMYLALRIGLIEQLGDVGSGLPVLMDDILVNFDAERRGGAARAIAELASIRQVVFFTCHAETAEVLAHAVPRHIRIELDRCAL